MKISTTPARWGILLLAALLAAPTLVASEDAIECLDHSDCEDEGYCASDGFCERMGGCAVVDDCNLEENQGYPIAACFGTLECTDRTCGMNCSGGSDALFMCRTSQDCMGANEYCNSLDTCRPMGACMVDEDCLVEDNAYPMIECVGRVFCDEGSVCAKVCGEPQGTPCATTDDCGAGDYCADTGMCQEQGFCAVDLDCVHPENSFLVAACVGPLTCENGMCTKTCVTGALESPCKTSDDCSGDLYCSTNGKCLESGSCGRVEDCSSPDNIFASVACLGAYTCDEGRCGKVCGDPCSDNSDCVEGDYCASNGICLQSLTCAIPDDCTAIGNDITMPACVGTVTCEEGLCGKVCDGVAGALEVPCKTSDDCSGDLFCSTNGKCMESGSCGRVEDCSSPDNIFASVACLGAFTCDEGRCGKVCGVPCSDNSDCVEGDYCASNGICLQSLTCAIPDDCMAIGNDITMPACVGTVTCEEGLCGKVCDGVVVDESKADTASAVDLEISGMSCTSDADCNGVTTSTARSAATPDSMYCAQGTCAQQGSCFTDLDCINPANILWNDKRCFGYVHCTEQGVCDRVCGEDCKSGDRAAECFEDVCETNDWSAVEGAVSCTMYKCKGGCDIVLFDASGGIVGLKEPPTGNKQDDPKTLPELDKDVLNLESSAVRATSLIAILAAVLAAGMA